MIAWRPVPGFEGRYQVSDEGQVKVLGGSGRGRFNEDRILKVGKDGPGNPFQCGRCGHVTWWAP